MDQDAISRHVALVRELAKPGQALTTNAPTATMNNPQWWVGRIPTPARAQLHQRLLSEARAEVPDVERSRRAYVLAGPPGAGKSTVLKQLLDEDERKKYLTIDADDFKKALLAEAVADGSYQATIKPQQIRDLEAQGEKFFPLELASLVHEESSYLALALRNDAIARGENIIIDTVLKDPAGALRMGEQLKQAGYTVQVIDVEVPYEVSEERIRGRWERAYTDALEGRNTEGGRWVPSEYARAVFDTDTGLSRSEVAARALADECPVVARYRMHFTTAEEAQAAAAEGREARPELRVALTRAAHGGPLLTAEQAAAQNRMKGMRPHRGRPRPKREGGREA